MSDRDHNYSYGGVRYERGDRVAGAGSFEILYFEAFHCGKCLDRRYVRLGYTGNSYDAIQYGATPKERAR